MPAALSPYRLGKARDLYNIFNIINAFAWQLLAGNVITLFALRMGANSTYVGTLSALVYVAFFFLPVGKLLSRRFPLVKIFSVAWVTRSVSMTPLLFAPFAYAAGDRDTALLLILLGVSLFHITRGIGLIGNNPILSLLASGPDRGSYMTQVQIVNSAVGMFAGFLIALLLGQDPPLFLYAIIVAVGIGAGVFSGILVRKVPEPETEDGGKGKNIFAVVREAFSQPSLRNFIYILIMVSLVSGVSRTFMVVYSRSVFNQSDGMVAMFAVFGGLGTLIIGLLIKFLVDRIGSKPIFIVCIILGFLSLFPVVFFPVTVTDYTTIMLYLFSLFFMMNFGWHGAEGIMQTYFMGLIPSEKMMDMGMVYFFFFGIAGALGALSGGAFLDLATAITGSTIISFRILYSIMIIISVVILFRMKKLVPLGALPFMGALEVMFSFRDLKAISLLEKLNKTRDSSEEAAILGALQDTPSRLAIQGLLNRVKSPRLAIRMESIRAIDAMDHLGEEAEKALLEDIINNQYTTAYRSARTLGNHGVFAAIPVLRELAKSSDYMLAGEAIISLAKLGDTAFKPELEKIINETFNPRLKMAAVEAFGIYGFEDSLPMLLDVLRGANPPPYLRDEVILSMASILDIQTKFYPLLVRFLADKSLAPTLAMDEAEAAYEFYMSALGRKRNKKDAKQNALYNQAKTLQYAVSEYVRHSKGSHLNKWILMLPDEVVSAYVQIVLSESVLDDELNNHPRLKLLIAHWTAHVLRKWTNKSKNNQ